MEFIQTDFSHAVNLETGKFMRFNDCFKYAKSTIFIPTFLWSFNSKEDVIDSSEVYSLGDARCRAHCKLVREYVFHLPDFEVRIDPPNKSWTKYERAEVSVCSVRPMKFFGIGVDKWCRDLKAGEYGAGFIIENGGKSSTYSCHYGDVAWTGKPFHQIRDLAYTTPFKLGNSDTMKTRDAYVAAYGLPCKQYDVYFRGRKIAGTSYVFLFGPWGILLSDDLKFDSLVIFRGSKLGAVDIDKVLFTVNPIMTKFEFLGG